MHVSCVHKNNVTITCRYLARANTQESGGGFLWYAQDEETLVQECCSNCQLDDTETDTGFFDAT
jgi:hypothetical protein